jgi:hypoxanthine phosphoribosyltransferase
MVVPRLKVIIREERIRRAVRRMAGEIDRYAQSHSIPELTIVCVMDGAFVFCADLVRRMTTPTQFLFVKASSYDGTVRRHTSLARIALRRRNQPVLVVDTIFDTGRTIHKVIAGLREQTSPIALAVLVEKRGKASVAELFPRFETFVGIKIEGDPFLVGYGLDCDGQYRQLRDIRVFRA